MAWIRDIDHDLVNTDWLRRIEIRKRWENDEAVYHVTGIFGESTATSYELAGPFATPQAAEAEMCLIYNMIKRNWEA